MKGQNELLRANEAAELMGLKESTVRKMIFSRQIDVVRPTKRAVRIPRAAIEKILKEGFRPSVHESESL